MLSVEEAIAHLRKREMIVISDDPERENEADLCFAAEFVTAEMVNFLLQHAHGLICTAISDARAESLDLPLLAAVHHPLQNTPFTISVDARRGTTTGISAADRACTISLLADPETSPDELARPGHLFPLRAHRKGVLGRRGHTEAAVDLMQLAELQPAAVICEVLNERGETVKGQELLAFAQHWQIGMISISEIVCYRQQQDAVLSESLRSGLVTE
jgi:3,4-dihydroxy 2-butanone 4-phosphate synthase/GTP cyclohydrolase II